MKGLPHPASQQCAQWILLWGVSVVAPLALRLVGRHPRLQRTLAMTGWLMLAGYLWEGPWLILASACWLLVTLAMAWQVRTPDRTQRLAFLYAPVGGVWALASAWQHGLMGFDPLMTLLTADHFCYVTLGAMVWAGQAGRDLAQLALYRGLIRFLWISPALVAIGITLSHWQGQTTLIECLGVTAQVSATTGISLVWLTRGAKNPALTASALCSLLTMGLALNYAWGRWLPANHLELAWMIPYHGLVNALGFVTLGLIAWSYRAT
ncbi:MAG: YndJ family transporter [Candidatus Eremiobacteraeota bacterium]|nr:YndJ family transporter [Candidatus Eremiobacteraeota bacterium]